MIRPLVQIRPSDLQVRAGVLRATCKNVVLFDQAFSSIVLDLKDTLYYHEISVGLAAPQIGVDLRIAVINISKEKTEDTIVIVNPRDVLCSGKKESKREACMSLPCVQGEVQRREKIQFVCEDEFGITKKRNASGFLARVFSHEIDHLDGILYADKMGPGVSLLDADFFSEKDILLS
jgi:peptide deformylase